jgi:hypothetical protein
VTCDVLCSQLYNHAHGYIPASAASSSTMGSDHSTHTIVISM